ncbi:MAG: YHS domain-containing (seleno)protein [Devosia sp.]|nr:YHS domain-containing (seleno)protein [Devosia sp.]
MRQIHKQTLTMVAALLCLLCAALATASARADGLVREFVTDPLTGVALDGFDAVSYFTEVEPLAGKPDYEFDWGGVPWYFTNAADRDVFARSPATYAPQFGGHATMALARGYLSDGNPQIYVLVAKRLYLFYSTGNRDAFLMSPARAIDDARAHWAEMSKDMAPLPATGAAGAATAGPAPVDAGNAAAPPPGK